MKLLKNYDHPIKIYRRFNRLPLLFDILYYPILKTCQNSTTSPTVQLYFSDENKYCDFQENVNCNRTSSPTVIALPEFECPVFFGYFPLETSSCHQYIHCRGPDGPVISFCKDDEIVTVLNSSFVGCGRFSENVCFYDDYVEPVTSIPTILPTNLTFCENKSFRNNIIYISWDVSWSSGIDVDIKLCVDSGFTVIILTFLQLAIVEKPTDAVLAWNALSKAKKRYILNYAETHNVKIVLGIGGQNDYIDGEFSDCSGYDRTGLIYQNMEDVGKFVNKAVNEVTTNEFHGIHYDLNIKLKENGESCARPFLEGYMSNFLNFVHQMTVEKLNSNSSRSISYEKVLAGDYTVVLTLLSFFLYAVLTNYNVYPPCLPIELCIVPHSQRF